MVTANLFGVLEGPELLIILAVVLLLFGGAKVPELARSLGQAKREFHNSVADQPATGAERVATETAADEIRPDDTVTVSRTELDQLRAAAAKASPAQALRNPAIPR
jgi:sec-independent protein translocase protein TatA